MDPILGQIILWPVPWVPQNWALCDGQRLAIRDYVELFSLIGTTYGGDGVTTFQLPDLRGRVPMGTMAMNPVGRLSGYPTDTSVGHGTGMLSLTVDNLPAHSHFATFTGATGTTAVNVAIPVDSSSADTNTPGNSVVLGKASAGVATPKVYSSGTANTVLRGFDVNVPTGGSGTVVNADTGSGAPAQFSVAVPVTVSTMQPSMTMNFIIATRGIYPARP